jgi:hypothetical protein
MSQGTRQAFLVALALAAVAAGSCSHETGPSLSAVIESQRLVPTSSQANAATLCCCRVQGTVRNTSSIAAHISLRWDVWVKGKETQATASFQPLDFQNNVPAGGSRAYDAAGLLAACSEVARIEPNIQVIGLYQLSGN